MIQTVNDPVHIIIEEKQTFLSLPFFQVVCYEGVISLTRQNGYFGVAMVIM